MCLMWKRNPEVKTLLNCIKYNSVTAIIVFTVLYFISAISDLNFNLFDWQYDRLKVLFYTFFTIDILIVFMIILYKSIDENSNENANA